MQESSVSRRFIRERCTEEIDSDQGGKEISTQETATFQV